MDEKIVKPSQQIIFEQKNRKLSLQNIFERKNRKPSLSTQLSKFPIHPKSYILLLYKKLKLTISININTQILFSSHYPMWDLDEYTI